MSSGSGVHDDHPLTRARRRAGRAKLAVAVGGGLAFLAAFGLSRSSYASHAKHHPRPLAAPGAFVDVVRRNLLQAGAVAPPTAPPVAETSTS
jgi:hypothetical protein